MTVGELSRALPEIGGRKRNQQKILVLAVAGALRDERHHSPEVAHGLGLVLVIATCVLVRSRFNRILYMGLKTTGGEGLGPVDPFPPPPPPLPPSVPRPSPPVRAAPDLDATQTGAEIIRASGSSPGGGVDMPPIAEIIVEEPQPAPPGGAAGGDEEI